jgi:hypothetical protein
MKSNFCPVSYHKRRRGCDPDALPSDDPVFRPASSSSVGGFGIRMSLVP